MAAWSAAAMLAAAESQYSQVAALTGSGTSPMSSEQVQSQLCEARAALERKENEMKAGVGDACELYAACFACMALELKALRAKGENGALPAAANELVEKIEAHLGDYAELAKARENAGFGFPSLADVARLRTALTSSVAEIMFIDEAAAFRVMQQYADIARLAKEGMEKACEAGSVGYESIYVAKRELLMARFMMSLCCPALARKAGETADATQRGREIEEADSAAAELFKARVAAGVASEKDLLGVQIEAKGFSCLFSSWKGDNETAAACARSGST